MALLSRTKENLRFSFIVLAVLISLNFWSFGMLPESTYRLLEALLLGGLILAIFSNSKVIRRKLLFRENVMLFMIIPLLSVISAWIYHGQSIPLSLLILRTNFFWLLYFVLHFFDIPKERIIKLMLVVGIVWMLITIVQQFTYPTYYFYSRQETDNYSILRSGVYRFMAYGHQYGGFVLVYFVYRFFIKRKLIYLPVIILSLIAFYVYGTRQFALAAIICIPLCIIFLSGKARLIALLVTLCITGICIYYREALFQQYIDVTKEQLQFGEDVRQLSAKFWLTEYWPHWMTKIFGNGRPHISSAYGLEMERIRSTFHFYRSDVGIIGAFNEFGILYVINIVWVNFRGIRGKLIMKDDRYLVIVFISLILLLLTSLYYSSSMGIPFYCLLFYIFEKSWAEKRQLAVAKDNSDGKTLLKAKGNLGWSN